MDKNSDDIFVSFCERFWRTYMSGTHQLEHIKFLDKISETGYFLVSPIKRSYNDDPIPHVIWLDKC